MTRSLSSKCMTHALLYGMSLSKLTRLSNISNVFIRELVFQDVPHTQGGAVSLLNWHDPATCTSVLSRTCKNLQDMHLWEPPNDMSNLAPMLEG